MTFINLIIIEIEKMRKEMLEEIKAQMMMNQQMIVESSTGFQERVMNIFSFLDIILQSILLHIKNK